MGKLKTQEEFENEVQEKYPNIKIRGKYVNGSTKIDCECTIDKYRWSAIPPNVLRNGCSVCNGHYMNDYTFKKRMKEVNSKVEVVGEYKDKATPVKCKCLICNNLFMGNVASLLNGSTHNDCRGRQITKTKAKSHEWFITELNKRYPDEYEVLGIYIKQKEPIKIRHKCGYEWSPTPDSLLRSRSKNSPCPKCSKVYRMTNEEYIELLKEKSPTIIALEEYINSDTKILHKCLNCGHEWKVLPSSITLNGRGCPMCKGGTDTVVVGVNDMWTTNPELASMLMNPEDGYKYSDGTSKKVEWKCKDCGESTGFKSINKVKARGLYCKRCSPKRSLPNRIMYNLLSELDVDFKDEKHFKWCVFKSYDGEKDNKGVYDFVIENKKLIVEMDGSVGHGYESDISSYSAEESLYRDKQKDRLAQEHGYKVIRIDCSKSTVNYIKDAILKSEFSKIYNLENINWNKCFYNSTTPIMRDVCDDYKHGIPIKELGAKYSKDISTIMKFLDIGTSAGLCNYEHNGIRVKIICMNDLCIYESIAETSRYYHISPKNIVDCCKGIRDGIKDKYNIRGGETFYFMYYENYLKLYKDINKEESAS